MIVTITALIQFTVEHEQNNTISFLDVKVVRHNGSNFFQPPSLKNLLTLTGICTSIRTTQNTKNSQSPKFCTTELAHTLQTILIAHNTTRTLKTHYCSTGFHENTPVYNNPVTTHLLQPNTSPLSLYLTSAECLTKLRVF